MALFLAACLQRPIQAGLARHIPRIVTALAILCLFLVPVAAALAYGLYRALSAAASAMDQLIPFVRGISWDEWFYRFTTALPPDAQAFLLNAVESLSDQSDVILTKLAAKLGTFSADKLANLPARIGSVALFILFYLFCAIGYPQTKHFLLSVLPKDWSVWLQRLTGIAKQQLINWCRAEGKLVFFVFGELSIGLCLLRTQAWLWIALCIAFVDMIPFIGAGLILFPWSLIQFLSGNRIHAIGIILLWSIVWITRTLMEPKLIGKHLQLPSAISFLSAVIGAKVWGLKGLIFFPVLTAVMIHVFAQEKKGTTPSSGALDKNIRS